MEKFALLDFLKAFQSLSAKGNAATNGAETPSDAQPSPQQPAPPPPPVPSASYAPYENNVMANVISRHEEISNRIKNKRSV